MLPKPAGRLDPSARLFYHFVALSNHQLFLLLPFGILHQMPRSKATGCKSRSLMNILFPDDTGSTLSSQSEQFDAFALKKKGQGVGIILGVVDEK